MSPRELLTLVWELPDESRFKRARGSGFSSVEALLARLINQYTQANADPDKFDPVRHLVHAPNDQPEVDQTPMFESAGYDEISRMLDGDMSVYAEIADEIAAESEPDDD